MLLEVCNVCYILNKGTCGSEKVCFFIELQDLNAHDCFLLLYQDINEFFRCMHDSNLDP